jgi:hypothetical protein
MRYIVPLACAFAGWTALLPSGSAQAFPVAPAPAIERQIVDAQYRARGGARRAVAVRPARPIARPGVRPGRPVAVVRPGGVYRPGAVYRPGGVYRPGAVYRPAGVYRPGYYGNWYRPYRWRPGGAIAAGAAIGFIGAAAAAAYYSAPPPAPGLCWYYTDPSRTSGFWDVCP